MIDPFLSYLADSRGRANNGIIEPSILAYDSQQALEDVAQRLEQQGYFRAHSWRGAINCFNLDLPVFMAVDAEICEELADFFEQYFNGSSIIEIVERNGRRNLVQLGPSVPELVLLTRSDRVR